MPWRVESRVTISPTGRWRNLALPVQGRVDREARREGCRTPFRFSVDGSLLFRVISYEFAGGKRYDLIALLCKL